MLHSCCDNNPNPPYIYIIYIYTSTRTYGSINVNTFISFKTVLLLLLLPSYIYIMCSYSYPTISQVYQVPDLFLASKRWPERMYHTVFFSGGCPSRRPFNPVHNRTAHLGGQRAWSRVVWDDFRIGKKSGFMHFILSLFLSFGGLENKIKLKLTTLTRSAFVSCVNLTYSSRRSISTGCCSCYKRLGLNPRPHPQKKGHAYIQP